MLTRWNPFGLQDARGTFPLFDTLFKDPFFRDYALSPSVDASIFAPAADIVETESAFEVKVDLPGHDPKDVQVKVESDTLTIRAERKFEKDVKDNRFLKTERTYGVFARTFVMPSAVDSQRTEAKYEQGVLTVTLHKREETKPKTIDIQVK